jgi:hypothetical protein
MRAYPARRPHGRKLIEGRESCRAALEVTVQFSGMAKAGQLSGAAKVFPKCRNAIFRNCGFTPGIPVPASRVSHFHTRIAHCALIPL